MAISHLPVAERIARIVAAHTLSINADGNDAHAAAAVDLHWKDYRDIASSILRTLREPDARMADAGDVANWRKMIEAALTEA